MRIEIATGLIDAVIALAAADPEREVCGLLFGAPGRIAGYLPARNVAGDPTTMFEIDPAMLFAVHRAARAGGPVPVGCYHSHPRGSAMPSERDRAGADPGHYWLIVAGRDVALYHARPDGRFDRCQPAST
ncbi:MAG TPA: M67 family metallopeptidase [Sphingomicrobium sp.]